VKHRATGPATLLCNPPHKRAGACEGDIMKEKITQIISMLAITSAILAVGGGLLISVSYLF
jgi:hypothetical protein